MCIRLLLFRGVARLISLLSLFGAARSMEPELRRRRNLLGYEPELRRRRNLLGYEIAAITMASTGGTF
jgi:hypothetical protein